MKNPITSVKDFKHSVSEKIATRNWVTVSLTVRDPKGFDVWGADNVDQTWITPVNRAEIKLAMLPRVGDKFFVNRFDLPIRTHKHLVGGDMSYFMGKVTEVEHIAGSGKFNVEVEVEAGSIILDRRGGWDNQQFHSYYSRQHVVGPTVQTEITRLKRAQWDAEMETAKS